MDGQGAQYVDGTTSGITRAPDGSGTRIRYDVHRGQSYEFDEWPTPPTARGRYVLEAGLVAEGVGALAADPPLRIPLEVGR